MDSVVYNSLTPDLSGRIPMGAQYGYAVEQLGDFDGDFVVDIAVGAPLDNFGGVERGALWIHFIGTYGTLKRSVKIGSNGGGFGGGITNGDRFGSSVAVIGDLDADGVTDLAVGAPYDGEAGPLSGAVWVLLMLPDGTVRTKVKLNGVSQFELRSVGSFDQFGSAVEGIGDIDGDGVADIAVGAPGDSRVATQAGSVMIVMLGGSGGSLGSVKSAYRITAGTAGFTASLVPFAAFGSSLSVVDRFVMANDTVESVALAVGSPGGGDFRDGAVWFLDVSPRGFVSGFTELSSRTYRPRLRFAEGDRFGLSVEALGDMNGDGIVDIAVGAPGDDTAGTNSGRVWVLMLDNGRHLKALTWFDAKTVGPGLLSPSAEGFGHAIAAAPQDNRGLPSTVYVGVPLDSSGSRHAGAVVVADFEVTGIVSSIPSPSSTASPTSSPSPSTSPLDPALISPSPTPSASSAPSSSPAPILWPFEGDAIEVGHEKGGFRAGLDVIDRFGSMLIFMGDFDMNGHQEILVGAPETSDSKTFAGAVWFLFMSGDGVLLERKIGSGSGGMEDVLEAGDRFGSSAALLGDIDGDEVPEVLVGAPGDNSAGEDAGAVWLLHMRPDGSARSAVRLAETNIDAGFLPMPASMAGSAVAVLPSQFTGSGDIGGNSSAIIVIGTPFWMPDGGVRSGGIWVLHISSTGQTLFAAVIDADDPQLSSLLYGHDMFGASMALVGSDGWNAIGESSATFVVGLPGQAHALSTDAERYMLLLVSIWDVGTVREAKPLIAAGSNVFLDLQRSFDVGASVAVFPGDADGTGSLLAVGDPSNGDNGILRGGVWLLRVDSTWNVTAYSRLDGSSPPLRDSPPVHARLGASLALAADVHTSDVLLLLGQPGTGSAGSGSGSFYMISGARRGVRWANVTREEPGEPCVPGVAGEFPGTGPPLVDGWDPSDWIPLDDAAGVRVCDVGDLNGDEVADFSLQRVSAGALHLDDYVWIVLRSWSGMPQEVYQIRMDTAMHEPLVSPGGCRIVQFAVETP